MPWLEIACFNPETVLHAIRAGASRIELCAGPPSAGGTTPSIATFVGVRSSAADRDAGSSALRSGSPSSPARAKRSIPPINIMIRPRSGSFVYTDEEFSAMRSSIEEFAASGFSSTPTSMSGVFATATAGGDRVAGDGVPVSLSSVSSSPMNGFVFGILEIVDQTNEDLGGDGECRGKNKEEEEKKKHKSRNRKVVDVERCKELVDLAKARFGVRECTFHRAFDEIIVQSDMDTDSDGHGDMEMERALEDVIKCGFSAVLTGGGGGGGVGGHSAGSGVEKIKRLIGLARGRIEIIPGGGVRSGNLEGLREKLVGVRWWHSSGILGNKRAGEGVEEEEGDPEEIRKMVELLKAEK